MAVPKELLDILVCPKSKAPLTYDQQRNALICEASQLVYRVEDDIPVMLVEEAEPLAQWRKRHGLDKS
ncbi:MAG: Trm112 family protein [Myxococcota bacterium]